MDPNVTTDFLSSLGVASARAGVVCVVVAMAVTLLGRRLAPRWRCVLWFLVILRLVWPFHIVSSVSLFEGIDTVRDWFFGQLFVGTSGEFFDAVIGGKSLSRVYFVWRLVAFLFALRLVGGSVWNLWRLRCARPLTSWDTWWLFQQAKEVYRLKTPVALLESPSVISPCLIGFFRPRIVIPENMLKNLTIEEVRLVFLHELAHLRRGDLWLGWIFEGLRTLHWFNPAVWYACRRFHEDREEACDAAALSAHPGANRTYGRLLLRFLSGSPRGLALLNAPGLTDGAATPPELLIRRIRAIASFRPGGRTWLLGLAVTILVFCVGFTEPKASRSPLTGDGQELAVCHRN